MHHIEIIGPPSAVVCRFAVSFVWHRIENSLGAKPPVSHSAIESVWPGGEVTVFPVWSAV